MSNGDLSDVFDGGGFDTSTVDPQSDFDVIPPGKYPVLIDKAEVKLTKKGDGKYINLEMSVLDGPHKGRKVFSKINVRNPSPQCVEIGRKELSALGRAVGVPVITDTSQLINKACIAHVKVKDDQNEARTYSPLTPAGAPGVPQQPAQSQAVQGQSSQPQQPKSDDGKPPWVR